MPEITFQKRLLNKSNTRYKKIVDTYHQENFKSQQIGYWLDLHSLKIQHECEEERKSFISFKPGTLIRVDFGVNIGSEISGQHFAIVLNRRDNSFKPTLTVVPLTSMDKKWYINIEMEVYDRIIEDLNKTKLELSKKYEEINAAIEVMEKSQSHPEQGNTDNYMSLLRLLGIIANINIDDEIKKMKVIDDFNPLLDELFDTFSLKQEKMQAEIIKLDEVSKKYQNYRKNSFADISQVTTISKSRIVSRVNEFDPMGKIQISKDLLDLLRAEINKII